MNSFFTEGINNQSKPFVPKETNVNQNTDSFFSVNVSSDNFRRNYSKGKSFKFSIWNEADTYNNDAFIQDFVKCNNKLWACVSNDPVTNIVPSETSDQWELILEGVSNVEFHQIENKIQWKYEDEQAWKDLVVLDSVSESEIKSMLEGLEIQLGGNDKYDDTLDVDSKNAVQNKVVTKAISQKQDIISDLEKIRIGAALGQSAIQSHQDISHLVEKEEGKGLSTEDFTTEEKEKLSSFKNYDDTYIKDGLETLRKNKQDVIEDLDTIRIGAEKGATALQSIPSEYVTGTQLETSINTAASKKQDKLVSGSNVKTINGESILGSGNIEIIGGGVTDTLKGWEDFDASTMEDYVLSAKLGYELYSEIDGIDMLLDAISGESIRIINEINGEII